MQHWTNIHRMRYLAEQYCGRCTKFHQSSSIWASCSQPLARKWSVSFRPMPSVRKTLLQHLVDEPVAMNAGFASTQPLADSRRATLPRWIAAAGSAPSSATSQPLAGRRCATLWRWIAARLQRLPALQRPTAPCCASASATASPPSLQELAEPSLQELAEPSVQTLAEALDASRMMLRQMRTIRRMMGCPSPSRSRSRSRTEG